MSFASLSILPARLRAVLLVTAVLAALAGPSSRAAHAQERVSRLDRVFHGFSYRPLERAVAAPEVSVAAPGGSEVAVSPHDDAVLYRFDGRVLRSEDRGVSWVAVSPVLDDVPGPGASPGDPGPADGSSAVARGFLPSVVESPVEPGLLWVGGLDGTVHRTRDGGASWEAVELPGESVGGLAQPLQASGYRGGTVFVRVDGAGEGTGDALLYRGDGYGEDWTLLNGPGSGLPMDEPMTAFREDPDGSGVLFLGTTLGVWVSFDDGGSWDLFQFGLPETEVVGLAVVGPDLVATTRDRGQWVMDDIGPLRQVIGGLATGEPYLFERSPVYLVGALPPDVVGRPGEAVFDYLLPSIVHVVRLEVLDGEGRLVISLDGSREAERALRDARGGDPAPSEERRTPGTRAGVHRVVWDLTAPDPSGGEERMRLSPGTYRLRMDVDGLVRERAFELLGSS